jgi:class 3 adenylate cyclase
MNYPIPDNDEQRLETLDSYNVVGTPPEFDFNEIAEIAGMICGCPVAVVNIVAEKWEWYKGKCGIPEHINREPRGGICSTTICSNELMIISDLAKDPRFSDHDIVKGKPFFRFYAGAPLINPEGFTLGSLCVLDHKPRHLDIQAAEALRCLSHQAVAQLELRRRLSDLEKMRRALVDEKQRSEDLLRNVLPRNIVDELKSKGKVQPEYFESATILLTDFIGFTRLTEHLEPRTLIEDLNEHFSVFDDIIERNGLEKIKTIGDAYMCVAGLPTRSLTHAVDACNAALEINDYMTKTNEAREKLGLPTWGIRIGLHSGGVIAGIVGKSKFSYDIWGDTVNVTALIEASADMGQIALSENTFGRIRDLFKVEFLKEINTEKKRSLRCYRLTGRS